LKKKKKKKRKRKEKKTQLKMNDLRKRLDSFGANGGWRHGANFAATPVRLAQAGFYFQPIEGATDRVVCFCCGTAVARWKPASDARTEHLRYCPNCPFLTGAYQKYRFESKRLESFAGKWMLPKDYLAQPWRLAKAGFYYSPRANAKDRCVCFCCGIALVHWEKFDDPWREHQKHAVTCAYVRGYPTDNIQLPGVATLSGVASSESKNEIEAMLEALDERQIGYEDSLDSYVLCPITQDFIRDPVVAEDGHTYEKSAIIQWLSTNNSSPMTNKQLHTKVLFPNHNLRAYLVDVARRLHDTYLPSSNPQAASSSDGASSSSSSSTVVDPRSLQRQQSIQMVTRTIDDEATLDAIDKAQLSLVEARRQLAQLQRAQPDAEKEDDDGDSDNDDAMTPEAEQVKEDDDTELRQCKTRVDECDAELTRLLRASAHRLVAEHIETLVSDERAALASERDSVLTEAREEAAKLVADAEASAAQQLEERRTAANEIIEAIEAETARAQQQFDAVQAQLASARQQLEQLRQEREEQKMRRAPASKATPSPSPSPSTTTTTTATATATTVIGDDDNSEGDDGAASKFGAQPSPEPVAPARLQRRPSTFSRLFGWGDK
jgi:Inhibitor of Apoptosis domain/U-box domain